MSKRLLPFILITSACCAAATARAGDRSDAAQLLEMWNPTSVMLADGALTVVLPQQRITEEIYMATLSSGLCLGQFLDMPLTGVRSVTVLNQFLRQGYVYEKGMETCDRIGDKIAVLGATHLY